MGKKKCVDFNEKSFCSEKEMCNYYGICDNTYRYRINKGWTQEEALLRDPYWDNRREVQDHNGRTFPSLEDLCAAYNITEDSYRARKIRNWPLEKILTTPMKIYKKRGAS